MTAQRSDTRPPLGPSPDKPTECAKPWDWLATLKPDEPVDAAGEFLYDDQRYDGGMGVVLRVRQRSTGDIRACKILRPELVGDAAAEQLFRSEFKRAHVSGRHVVTLYDIGQIPLDAGAPARTLLFFTMDWVAGPSLRALLRAHPGGLDPRRAFDLSIQAAEGLAEIHAHGVLHLDLKPSNLLLDADGQLKIVDFGIGKDLRRRHDEAHDVRWMTSRYASWELQQGYVDRLGPASDVYSLAIIVYELFCGVPCLLVNYEHVSARVDCVPELLDHVILSSLSDRPESRREAAVLADALRQAQLQFERNAAAGRVRPERGLKELWSDLQAVARRQPPEWEQQAALAAAILAELESAGQSILPWAKVPEEEVRELHAAAEAKLRERREELVDRLIDRKDWQGAEERLAEWALKIADTELASHRRSVELCRLVGEAVESGNPELLVNARQRLLDLLAGEVATPRERERARALFESLIAAPAEPAPETGSGTFVWEVASAAGSAALLVVRGTVLRLGRGGLAESGNHVDLRPTDEEAAANAAASELCMQISRSHLELRFEGARVVARCAGTYGAHVDAVPVPKGSECALADSGTLSIAAGASSWRYAAHRSAAGGPVALVLEGCGGIGAGRRAALVAGPFDGAALAPALAAGSVTVAPAAGAWHVTARVEGLRLGLQQLKPGTPARWAEGTPLSSRDGCTVTWGQA